jgi:hypothetical protein
MDGQDRDRDNATPVMIDRLSIVRSQEDGGNIEVTPSLWVGVRVFGKLGLGLELGLGSASR